MRKFKSSLRNFKRRNANILYPVFLLLICFVAIQNIGRRGARHNRRGTGLNRRGSGLFSKITKLETIIFKRMRQDVHVQDEKHEHRTRKATEKMSSKSGGKRISISLPKKSFWGLKKKPRSTIKVATTVCNDRLMEVVTLVKSILIFSRRIELHIVADATLHENVKTELEKVFSSFNGNYKYTIHDLWFPKENNQEWENMGRPCNSQRLFLPMLLKESDNVIYLNPDTLVLNSLENLWRHFNKFNADQMIGASLVDVTKQHNTFPILGEMKISNGVMLMNLTRMRRFRFVDRITKTLDAWRNLVKHGDEDFSNILRRDYPDSVYLLPCEWHYRPSHCNHGNTCATARTQGVNLIDGERQGYNAEVFRVMFDVIAKFDLRRDQMRKISKTIEERVLKQENGSCRSMLTSFVKHIRRIHPAFIISA